MALLVLGLWPEAVPVETATVTVGPLRTSVNEEGKTRIKHRFIVSAPVTGQLRRIPFKPGAEVVVNQTIVAIIDPLASSPLDPRSRITTEARRDAAAANVEKARAAHTFAASELRRNEKLYAEGTVSAQDLEAAQWRETTAARELTAAESAFRQTEAELADFAVATDGSADSSVRPTEVRAPITGRVLRVFEESARAVTSGLPLIEIGDPNDLEVVIEVLSRDGAIIGPGTKVELEQWGGGQPLAARVRLVEPAAFTKISALGVEEQRVNVVADLVTPPEQRLNLGDNFRVEARIATWETDRTLKVPAGALFRRGPQWESFVLEGGRVRLRQVTVGRSSGTETEILNGLKEGEEVVVYPGDRVRDGLRVKPIEI
ncbi:MAG: efflux RND transporter periplasmic adaptor subunit [Verrucomicrobia bacterium]|nr:efflux RND transporter periplasmic adaptor subunit [Verrucomicrobiota bacterium]